MKQSRAVLRVRAVTVPRRAQRQTEISYGSAHMGSDAAGRPGLSARSTRARAGHVEMRPARGRGRVLLPLSSSTRRRV